MGGSSNNLFQLIFSEKGQYAKEVSVRALGQTILQLSLRGKGRGKTFEGQISSYLPKARFRDHAWWGGWGGVGRQRREVGWDWRTTHRKQGKWILRRKQTFLTHLGGHEWLTSLNTAKEKKKTAENDCDSKYLSTFRPWCNFKLLFHINKMSIQFNHKKNSA